MKTEDYVSYELAVKLREKGFSETTLGKYVDCHKDPTLFHGMFYEPWNIEKDSINAPSLSQAQKWLREEKMIDIDISTYRLIDYVNDKIERSYEFEIAYKDEEYHSDEYFKTYESALAEALNQALELI